MFGRKKKKEAKVPVQKPAQEKAAVKVSGWKEQVANLPWGTFPGPQSCTAPLRVYFEGNAFADFLLHSKSSLKAEVCGVLVGKVFRDNTGPFVCVSHVLQGLAAREQKAQVTFTQETWDHIYARLEKDYPKLNIVGWYHTHPSFGTIFSDMDLFVHKNFFPSPTQVALLTDPLSGEVAACFNNAGLVTYLDSIWVEQNAIKCVNPEKASQLTGNPSQSGVGERLEHLETRVNQLVRSVESMLLWQGRMLTFLAILGLGTVSFVILYSFFNHYVSVREQPQEISFVPIPIEIEGKQAMIGLSIVSWDLPPELKADYEKMAMEKLKKQLMEQLENQEAQEQTQ